MEIYINQQLFYTKGQLLQCSLAADIGQVANASQVINIMLLFFYPRDNIIPPPNHHIGIITRKPNTVLPRWVSISAVKKVYW